MAGMYKTVERGDLGPTSLKKTKENKQKNHLISPPSKKEEGEYDFIAIGVNLETDTSL